MKSRKDKSPPHRATESPPVSPDGKLKFRRWRPWESPENNSSAAREEELRLRRWWPLDWGLAIPEHIWDSSSWKSHVQVQHNNLHASTLPRKDDSETVDGINLGILVEYYHSQVSLYEKYLDLLIKFNIFYFAIIGGILSFYFLYLDSVLLKWSLLGPILVSAFFAVLFAWAYRSLRVINQEIVYMSNFLGFRPPGVNTLSHALSLNFCLLIVIMVGLIGIVIFDKQLKTDMADKRADRQANVNQAGK